MVQPDRLQMKTQCCAEKMRFSCWKTKTRNTLRICNIIAFPLQQWLHERASMLRYTHTVCLVTN